MKNLLLIRHTKSNWGDYSLRDFDRPIKTDRQVDAQKMSLHITRVAPPPDVVLCSPALRTRQTAAFFCPAWHYPAEQIVYDMRLYESSAEEYIQVIRETDAAVNTLAVVGHNPSLTDFANLFLNKPVPELPTTGVVWLQLHTADWEIYRNTPSSVKGYFTPKTI